MDLSFSFYEGISSNTCQDVVESTFIARDIVSTFFGEKLSGLKIITAQSHRHLCALIGKKRPKYGVTTTFNDRIYLYNPSLWNEEETGHASSDLTESLAHQMSHLVFQRNKIISPKWFEEGVAVFVGSGLSKQKRESDFSELIHKHGLLNLSNDPKAMSALEIPALGYLTSYQFIKYLVKTYGKSKLDELSFALKESSDFSPIFTKVMKTTVNQAWKDFEQELIKVHKLNL